jgi:YD repeat-containing protein
VYHGRTHDKADRLLTAGGYSLTVDDNGDTIAYPGVALTYDRANRLTSTTGGGVTATYAYDGNGTRVGETVGGVATSYAPDANCALPVVLTDGARKYVWGLGLAYAKDPDGNVQAVYHADGLGSVRALTDAGGNLLETDQTTGRCTRW